MANDNSTVVIKDIKSALSSAEREANSKPAALLGVGGELNGKLYDIKGVEVTVGRNPENAIPLDYQGVSRVHFRLEVADDYSVTLVDLGSKNGTFVNNQKVENAIALNKGDVIKIGSIALKFLPRGDTERLAYDKLNLDANTDRHTGCYNKTYFNNAIEEMIKKSKVTGEPLSLIIFDLDHFKKLNDGFGHDAGDYVLKEMAGLIRAQGVREHDVFARYGGEEFVILLPKTNIKNAFEIAERLRRLVEAHNFMYDNKKLPVTASIGISDYRQGVNSGTDLFKRADEAVYKSKEGGRNQVNFYKP